MERLERKVDRLEKQKINQTDLIGRLEKRIQQLESSINRSKQSTDKDVTRPFKDLSNKTTSVNRINGQVTAGRVNVPQSCRDLASLGHTLNGFYQVKSASNPKKMATLMCDFNSNGTQSKFFIFSETAIFLTLKNAY